jgi:hypothetical protein
MAATPGATRAKHPGKVFWFFFSKKNILPSPSVVSKHKTPFDPRFRTSTATTPPNRLETARPSHQAQTAPARKPLRAATNPPGALNTF